VKAPDDAVPKDGGAYEWAVRVDARKATKPVSVDKFKADGQKADLDGEDISGTARWYVVPGKVK